MTVKKVRNYTALDYEDGTTRINIYFTDGTESAYTGLGPVRARLILSILRSEKPVYWTANLDILWTGREPVGEGETDFNLDGWLSERPAIGEAILWEASDSSIVAYPAWSAGMKNALRNAVATLLGGGALVNTDPPPLAVTPGEGETAATRLSQSTAWTIFIAHVAQSIVVEACQYVRWTLNSLGYEELRQLFDSRSLFHWDSATSTYRIIFQDGVATPGDPVATFQFLVKNDLVGPNRISTIHRVLDWCRNNLVHFSGGWDVENVHNQWQYRGFPPVSRIIGGTPDLSRPDQPNRHRTGGCWGTTGFLRAILRTIDIPVRLVSRAGHAQPHFMHEGLYLSHGDDPYNAMMRAVPEIPISLLPIDQTKHNDWFGPLLPTDEVANNIGRRSTELGLEYLSNWLLRKRCNDIASGTPNADSEVYDTLKRYWTVAALEEMDLWMRLDEKIESMGGCGSIPP